MEEIGAIASKQKILACFDCLFLGGDLSKSPCDYCNTAEFLLSIFVEVRLTKLPNIPVKFLQIIFVQLIEAPKLLQY